MNWLANQKYRKIADNEIFLIESKQFGSAEINVAVIYPNRYHIAMSNLGYLSIYAQLNKREDVVCHRGVLPEDENQPFLALESLKPFLEYDIIGFSVSFEMDYINIVKQLEMAKIPVYSKDRNERFPLIICGGPSVTFNPEPLADFIDLFVIGEGEEVIHELIEVYNESRHLSKEQMLFNLAQIEGIYVPRFYEPLYNETGTVKEIKAIKKHVKIPIKKRWVKNLDKYDTCSFVLTPNTEFGDMFLIEISRGCGRNCRFCMAGYCYRIPRNRSIKHVTRLAEEAVRYRNRVGLVGAAVSDYPYIDDLSNELVSRGISFSVASLRADSLTETLAENLAKSGQKTITIAPEAASQKMRNIINKGINEEDIFNSLELASKKGIQNVKLYFIIGLPGENEEDVFEIINLTNKIRCFLDKTTSTKSRITLSINPFIPKPFTPFQWFPLKDIDGLNADKKMLQKNLNKIPGVKTIFESIPWSKIQCLLARGDRRLGDVIYKAFKYGATMGAWKKALKNTGLDWNFYTHRKIPYDEVLPWDHIDIGIKKSFFIQESKRAMMGLPTTKCSDEKCQTCMICAGLKEVTR